MIMMLNHLLEMIQEEDYLNRKNIQNMVVYQQVLT